MQLIAEMKLKVAECLGQQSVGSMVEFNGLVINETMSSFENEGKIDD